MITATALVAPFKTASATSSLMPRLSGMASEIMFVNGRLRRAERPTDRAVMSSFCVLSSMSVSLGMVVGTRIPGPGGDKNRALRWAGVLATRRGRDLDVV